MGVRINLIGSISLTEIFVLLYSPHLFIEFRHSKIPYLRIVCGLFLALIVFQVLSEYMIGNTLTNALKGIAGTVMALLLFLFFLERLCKDYTLIKLIPIALLLKLVLWGDQFGFAEEGGSTYFKFYVAFECIYKNFTAKYSLKRCYRYFIIYIKSIVFDF